MGFYFSFIKKAEFFKLYFVTLLNILVTTVFIKFIISGKKYIAAVNASIAKIANIKNWTTLFVFLLAVLIILCTILKTNEITDNNIKVTAKYNI